MIIAGYLGYFAAINLGNIDGNWWGTGLDPYEQCVLTPSSCSGSSPTNVYYNALTSWNSDGESDAGTQSGDIQYICNPQVCSPPQGALCDSGTIPSGAICPSEAKWNVSIVKKGNLTPLSGPSDTTNCDTLYKWEQYYAYIQQTQQEYDAAKKFIAHCYNDYRAAGIFQDFSAALQILSVSDTALLLQARQWLESVLYLDTTDPNYFCECVYAIGGTWLTHDTSNVYRQKITNDGSSIQEWEVQHGLCDTTFLSNQIQSGKNSEVQNWMEDTNAYKLDTAIPPLDSVDSVLYNLLEKHFIYASVAPAGANPILSNITANPNPAQDGTIITFGISKEAYVKLELYDVLGHPLGTGDFESLCEPGNKSVPISLAGLPSGTYYARIQTAYGEVESVKIVKE